MGKCDRLQRVFECVCVCGHSRYKVTLLIVCADSVCGHIRAGLDVASV